MAGSDAAGRLAVCRIVTEAASCLLFHADGIFLLSTGCLIGAHQPNVRRWSPTPPKLAAVNGSGNAAGLAALVVDLLCNSSSRSLPDSACLRGTTISLLLAWGKYIFGELI